MQSARERSSEILQPIPLEEWPLLQELLKVDWPTYASYYYFIQNSIKWKKQSPNLALEIYCPHGKYQEDVTFVAISSFSTYDVVIFTKDRSGKRLYEALVRTHRFNWSKEVIFHGVIKYTEPILLSVLNRLRKSRGIKIKEVLQSCFYIKPADDSANLEIKVPEECYLRNLNLSHVPIVHSVWPRANKEQPETTLKLVRTLITLNKSIGLFLKKGDVLVSWALQNEWNALGLVQTLESYKRRGYGRIVVSAMAKLLEKEGISPMIAIMSGNTASQIMCASLNFKPNYPCTWIIMKKQLLSAL